MMHLKKYFIFAAIAVAALSVFSCKDKNKDDETEVLPSLNGSISITMQSYDYVQVGDTIKATPSGITRPSDDKGGVGYYWVISDAASFKDTTRYFDDPDTVTGELVFEIPDTTGNITFTCCAYAPGYYSSSASFTVSIIDREKSMTDLYYSDKCQEFTDPRDGKIYKYEVIGNTAWFCRNLAYRNEELKAIPFCNCDVMEDFFGEFYTWEQAMQACPEGWRVPSENDWVKLADTVTGKLYEAYNDFAGAAIHFTSDAYFNGKRMWEFWPETRPSLATSLNIIPSGYAIMEGTSSYYFYDSYDTDFNYFCAMLWTSDEYDEDKAFYRYIYNDKYPDVLSAYAGKKTAAFPTRCVKDVE